MSGRRIASTDFLYPTMTPILAFDIETIPDIAGLRRLHELPADLVDDRAEDWRSGNRPALL